MEEQNNTTDLLPIGIQQALVFCIEEIRMAALNGISTVQNQLRAAQSHKPVDRAAVLPMLQNQLQYWKHFEATLDYLLSKIDKRFKWIKLVRGMPIGQAIEHGINTELWEQMGWTPTLEA